MDVAPSPSLTPGGHHGLIAGVSTVTDCGQFIDSLLIYGGRLIIGRIDSKPDEIVDVDWREPADCLEPVTGGPFSSLPVGPYRPAFGLDHDAAVLEAHRIQTGPPSRSGGRTLSGVRATRTGYRHPTMSTGGEKRSTARGTRARPIGDDATRIRVLVLPAFVGEAGDPCELRRWIERYDFAGTVSIPGVEQPLRHTTDGLGVVPTGMGKSAAATTAALVCTSSRIELTEPYVLSVGIAGVAPTAGTLGAVFLADTVVDWDHKYRLDPTEEVSTGLLPYRRRDPVYRLNESLLTEVAAAVNDVPLADDARLTPLRERYEPAAARSPPQVGVGPTVSSDEYWHGSMVAERVQWFLDEYAVGQVCTTQMEDYGTATALARLGYLDRYLSVRAGVNFDRPPRNQTSKASFEAAEGTAELTVGLENAFRVGSAIVDHFLRT